MSGALGRRVPTDFDHVDKHPFSAVAPPTVFTVEKSLVLPSWHKTHNQGSEGSCVGHGTVMERAITNTAQNKLLAALLPTRRYDPISMWNRAKEIDEWADTNPGDDNGTSVRAAYDVLRAQGARRCRYMMLDPDADIPKPVGLKSWDVNEGILSNRWATSVDQIRSAIAAKNPVTIGVNWYSAFDSPTLIGKDWWIDAVKIGTIRGGHCVVIYGASDLRQAFLLKNSWGTGYAGGNGVWVHYDVMARLLHEDGEATLQTDR